MAALCKAALEALQKAQNNEDNLIDKINDLVKDLKDAREAKRVAKANATIEIKHLELNMGTNGATKEGTKNHFF